MEVWVRQIRPAATYKVSAALRAGAPLSGTPDRGGGGDGGRGVVIGAGVEPGAGDRVIGRVDRAEWKRRQFAPGPKISSLAFGRDRRLPITSRWREQNAPQT